MSTGNIEGANVAAALLAWAACARWRGSAIGGDLIPGQQRILGRDSRAPPGPWVQALANKCRVAPQQAVVVSPWAGHRAREPHVTTALGQLAKSAFTQFVMWGLQPAHA